MTPEAVLRRGLVVPNQQNALISEAQWRNGLAQGPLSEQGEVLWANAWAAVKSV
jgi:hypothetical protein